MHYFPKFILYNVYYIVQAFDIIYKITVYIFIFLILFIYPSRLSTSRDADEELYIIVYIFTRINELFV